MVLKIANDVVAKTFISYYKIVININIALEMIASDHRNTDIGN